MKLPLALILVLASSACQCGGPPTGACNGTWGGVSFTGVELDDTSRFVSIERTSCTDQDLKSYAVSWGTSAIALAFSFKTGGPSVLAERVEPLPLSSTSSFLSFALTPGEPPPAGTLTLGIVGLAARRTGTLALEANGEQLTCTFDLPFAEEGTYLSCGGSSGGADFD